MADASSAPAAATAPAATVPAPVAAAPAAPAPAASPAPPATSTLSESEKDILAQKIRSQIEFYFSDSNLPGDKFLRQIVDTTPGGWVPVATLASFNRIKALTGEVAFVAQSLRGSETVELEEPESGARARRRAPLSAADQAAVDARSIYAKGWPKDPEPTIDEVTKFWSEHGKVLSVRLRRYTGKVQPAGRVPHGFKGTLIVEFDTPETAKAVLEKRPAPPGGADWAEFLPKTAWLENEKKLADQRQVAKKKAKEDSKEGESNKRPREDPEYPKGTLVKVDGLGDEVNPMPLKEELNKVVEIQFVDVPTKKAEAPKVEAPKAEEAKEEAKEEEKPAAPAAAESVIIRTKDAEGAKKLMEHLKEKGAMGKTGLTAVLLEGDEEKAHWERVFGAAAESRAKRGRGGHRGRGRGRGRGGRGRGRQ